ncbi:hypothetical protein ATKI12_7539 [Kitasatospora sp. Ki12]
MNDDKDAGGWGAVPGGTGLRAPPVLRRAAVGVGPFAACTARFPRGDRQCPPGRDRLLRPAARAVLTGLRLALLVKRLSG